MVENEIRRIVNATNDSFSSPIQKYIQDLCDRSQEMIDFQKAEVKMKEQQNNSR